MRNEIDKKRGSDGGSNRGSVIGIVVDDVKNISSGSKVSVATKGNAVSTSTIKEDVAGANYSEAFSSDTITGISSIGAGEIVAEKQSKSEIDSTYVTSTSTSTTTSSFFTMIACSAAVLFFSLKIAPYLK